MNKGCFSALFLLVALVCFQCAKKKENVVTIHCESLANDILPTNDSSAVFIANAFTPNRDGINDAFRPILKNIVSESIKIYDSTSQLVFEGKTLNGYWRPTLPAGVNFAKYYYRVEATTQNNNRIGKCGEVYTILCFPPTVGKNNFQFEDQFMKNGFTLTSNEPIASCH